MPTPLIPIKNKNRNKKKKVGIFFYTPNAISHKSLFWRNMDLQWLLDVLAPFEVEIINFTHQGEHEFPDYVRDLSAQLVDWLDTSLALEELDLLISIDSAIAHLGLALEVPTLVVLGQRFEWRWGRVEQPESFFWPLAHIFVIKDADQDKSAMSSLVADILKIKHT